MAGKRFTVRVPQFARAAISDGKPQIERRFEEEEVGEAWVADIKAKIKKLKAGGQAQAIGIEKRRDISFTSAAGLWLESVPYEPTRKWYAGFVRRHLVPRFGSWKVGDITRRAVQTHVQDRLSRGSSPSNVNRDLVILSALFTWTREAGYSVQADALKVVLPAPLPEVERVFNPEAVRGFLASAVSRRDWTILAVAAVSGLRQCEVKAFHCSWIRWRERRIVVPSTKTFTPKNRKERQFPLHQALEKILLEWLGNRRDGLVFPPIQQRTRLGESRASDIRRVLRRVKKASDGLIRGMHDLRHFFLSLLGYERRPAPEIQQVAGHSSLRMVDTYVHASPDHLREVRDALDQSEVLAEVLAGPEKKPEEGEGSEP